MNKGTKYFYFFTGTLVLHVHFYKGWVDMARNNGLPIELVTILPLRKYFKQWRLVRKYKAVSYFHIIICGVPKMDFLVTFIYFFFILLFNKKVVVQLQKRDPAIFDLLKKIFHNKLEYIIELEGDFESEKDYLVKHPYKEDFYEPIIESMSRGASLLRGRLNKADHIFVVAPKFKELLTERYPALNLDRKIDVIPTGVDCERCCFSERTREEKRKQLGLENKYVMVYIGNAYYSWQNVFRTIEIFKLVKEKITKDAFLLLLVGEYEHFIVREFIDYLGLSDDEYILTQVDHEEIPKYLAASDIGVLLRHKHIMNEVASPGKFGDYVACGLPVLMTEGISNFSEELSKTDYGIILKDMDDDDEIIKKFSGFLHYDKQRRIEISKWARRKFSTEAYSQRYVNALRKLAVGRHS